MMMNNKFLYKFLTHNYIPLIVIIFSLFMTQSCGKKWKKTTVCSFQFDITKGYGSNNLQFNTGYMILRKIKFTGDRKQGDDVDFSNDIYVQTDFATGNISAPVKYDIPQGTYKTIDLEVEVHDEGSVPSIQLNGTYINSVPDTIPVLFQFFSGETFKMQGTTQSGSNEIILIEGTPATTQITFNPVYWFGTVTKSMLDSATLTNISSVPTIVISNNDNQNIFNFVSDRIDESNKAIFK